MTLLVWVNESSSISRMEFDSIDAPSPFTIEKLRAAYASAIDGGTDPDSYLPTPQYGRSPVSDCLDAMHYQAAVKKAFARSGDPFYKVFKGYQVPEPEVCWALNTTTKVFEIVKPTEVPSE